MTTHVALLFALTGVVTLGVAHAAPPAAPPVRLPEFFVTGERIGALELAVPRGDLRPPEPNLGLELLAIPGVYAHARAVDAMEPNIRGLALDRVGTTLNGIPLVNASPERTNSPVVILGPAAVADVTVTKALPSVTLGPATTGGRISLSTEDPRERIAESGPAHASVTVTYNGARDGVLTRGRFGARAGSWRTEATFFHSDLGDYAAPDGRRVAARLSESGASAALGWENPTHRMRAEFLQRRLRHQEAVSLPLDGKNTESQVFTFNHRWLADRGALQQVEWRAGGSFTDPYITSEDRKGAPATFALGRARSAGGGAKADWRLGEATLATGADVSWQRRRAVRTTPAGTDYIWPDAIYTDVGVFAELMQKWRTHWEARVGVRGDEVRSDARDADRPALGRPIREQFIRYNGASAGDVSRREVTGAANALLRWDDRRGHRVFVGGGVSEQPAPVTERYRAFLNALGGDGHGGNAVELGNPALQAERKWAIEAGGTWQHRWADFEATLYYYRVDDFVLRTRIGTTLPPLANMVVFGYRNVDANLFGAECGIALKPSPRWTVPLTFAVAKGRERGRGIGLPEIPPWEATFAVRHRSAAKRFPVSAELGARIVGARRNPAPTDNPLFADTAGFSLWHVRAGVPLGERWRIETGVENLLDRTYTEYLTPPVAPFRPASGNLQPGERVPGARRSAWLSLTWRW